MAVLSAAEKETVQGCADDVNDSRKQIRETVRPEGNDSLLYVSLKSLSPKAQRQVDDKDIIHCEKHDDFVTLNFFFGCHQKGHQSKQQLR